MRFFGGFLGFHGVLWWFAKGKMWFCSGFLGF